MSDLITGDDGSQRCGWCGTDSRYCEYHDKEWGYLALDDATQFEFLILESAQAGLSWRTVLYKREAYRSAYMQFNPHVVARWGEDEVQKLLSNPGIIRNRRKIESSITNARLFLEISEKHGSFSNWLSDFFPRVPLVNHWKTLDEIPANTPLSDSIASEMKKYGFRFFGSTIAYAHLQATGFINDHLIGCWRRNEDH